MIRVDEGARGFGFMSCGSGEDDGNKAMDVAKASLYVRHVQL